MVLKKIRALLISLASCGELRGGIDEWAKRAVGDKRTRSKKKGKMGNLLRCLMSGYEKTRLRQ